MAKKKRKKTEESVGGLFGEMISGAVSGPKDKYKRGPKKKEADPTPPAAEEAEETEVKND